MIEKEITVVNKLGIHARPSTMIVKKAGELSSSIKFIKDGIEADAKSIMSLMMLAAGFGSKLLLRVEGPDEESAVSAIEELFATKFNED